MEKLIEIIITPLEWIASLGFLIGWLFVFFPLYVLDLLFYQTWPVGLLGILFGTSWFFARSSKGHLLRAIATELLSITVALTVVTLVLLVVNSWGSVTLGGLRQTEWAVLRLSEWLPHWTKLSYWAAIFAVSIVMLAAIALPECKPVSRFVVLSKWLSKATSILTLVASFTFFSGAAITAKDAEITRRLELKYRNAKDLTQYYLTRYVSYKAARRSLTEVTPHELGQFKSLFAPIAMLPTTREMKREIASDVIRAKFGPQDYRSEGATRHQDELAKKASQSGATVREVFRRQISVSNVARDFAAEEELGLRKVAKRTLKLSTDIASVAAWQAVEQLVASLAPEVELLVKPIVDTIVTTSIEKSTDPLVDQMAKQFRGRMEQLATEKGWFDSRVREAAAAVAREQRPEIKQKRKWTEKKKWDRRRVGGPRPPVPRSRPKSPGR